MKLAVIILAYCALAVLAGSGNVAATPTEETDSIVSKLQEPQTLRFRVSGRDLADEDLIGTTDPFVKMFAQRGVDWVLFGTSEVVRDVLNVNWQFVFEYEFILGIKQFWKVEVWDHDRIGRDDLVGKAMVSVDNYLELNQFESVPLSTKGTITFRKAD